mgnify:CR=1 FL=1
MIYSISILLLGSCISYAAEEKTAIVAAVQEKVCANKFGCELVLATQGRLSPAMRAELTQKESEIANPMIRAAILKLACHITNPHLDDQGEELPILTNNAGEQYVPFTKNPAYKKTLLGLLLYNSPEGYEIAESVVQIKPCLCLGELQEVVRQVCPTQELIDQCFPSAQATQDQKNTSARLRAAIKAQQENFLMINLFAGPRCKECTPRQPKISEAVDSADVWQAIELGSSEIDDIVGKVVKPKRMRKKTIPMHVQKLGL